MIPVLGLISSPLPRRVQRHRDPCALPSWRGFRPLHHRPPDLDWLVYDMGMLPFSCLPPFTVGIQISTVANPSSFNDFHTANGSDQLAVPYFKGQGPQGCIPINIGALGLSGVSDGSNVTLQFIQDGSDGQLYQVRQTSRFFILMIHPSPISCSAWT